MTQYTVMQLLQAKTEYLREQRDELLHLLPTVRDPRFQFVINEGFFPAACVPYSPYMIVPEQFDLPMLLSDAMDEQLDQRATLYLSKYTTIDRETKVVIAPEAFRRFVRDLVAAERHAAYLKAKGDGTSTDVVDVDEEESMTSWLHKYLPRVLLSSSNDSTRNSSANKEENINEWRLVLGRTAGLLHVGPKAVDLVEVNANEDIFAVIKNGYVVQMRKKGISVPNN